MAKKDSLELLEKLRLDKLKLEKKMQAIKHRQKAEEKKAEVRRKILVGEAVLEGVRKGRISEQTLAQVLEEFVVKDRDREFLGLAKK